MKYPLSLALDRKLAAYAVAGGFVALVSPTPANASVIPMSGPINVAMTTSPASTNFDVDGNGTADFTLSSGLSINPADPTQWGKYASIAVKSGAGVGVVDTFVIPGVWVADPLAPGSVVNSLSSTGAGVPFAKRDANASGSVVIGEWDAAGTQAYVGLAFLIGTETHYGWALVGTTLTDDTSIDGNGLTVYNWAYEDAAGTAIRIPGTAPTPEPSTLALGALGAAGILALRRRQQSR
jgi:MYXO-CTERM domain-containing protein